MPESTDRSHAQVPAGRVAMLTGAGRGIAGETSGSPTSTSKPACTATGRYLRWKTRSVCRRDAASPARAAEKRRAANSVIERVHHTPPQ
jgi:hypothetical protein